jgi:hypothetical protein
MANNNLECLYKLLPDNKSSLDWSSWRFAKIYAIRLWKRNISNDVNVFTTTTTTTAATTTITITATTTTIIITTTND